MIEDLINLTVNAACTLCPWVVTYHISQNAEAARDAAEHIHTTHPKEAIELLKSHMG